MHMGTLYFLVLVLQLLLFHFQANVTRTNHIMWTMGTDFRYQYATSWFRQMDKFIHYVKMVYIVVVFT